MSQLARDPTLVSSPVDVDWFLAVVRDAQAGNIAAFDTLFQRYDARICTYLARMVGNDEEGRDLAQETFIKVWRALPAMHEEWHTLSQCTRFPNIHVRSLDEAATM